MKMRKNQKISRGSNKSGNIRLCPSILKKNKAAVCSTSVDAYQAEKTSLGKCPICGADVYDGKKSYYCGNYKAECRFSIWKEICGSSVSASDAQVLLTGKQTKVKKCTGKSGKEFQAHFKLEKDKVIFVFPKNKIKKK